MVAMYTGQLLDLLPVLVHSPCSGVDALRIEAGLELRIGGLNEQYVDAPSCGQNGQALHVGTKDRRRISGDVLPPGQATPGILAVGPDPIANVVR